MPSGDVGKVLGKWVVIACLGPLFMLHAGVTMTVQAVIQVDNKLQAVKHRRRAMARRLPKSSPLINGGKLTATIIPPGALISFLHLPLEIRLHIYRLAFGDPKIVQVNAGCPFWGPLPMIWVPAQHVRGDEDAPSKALRAIIGLGGSGFRQSVAPPRNGCVRYHAVSNLICGEEHHLRPGWARPELNVFHTDLMRTCRTVYGEVLDLLYAANTISLFGVEMVRYFNYNASPEGLCRVRFAHIALTISSTAWDTSRQRNRVEEAVQTLFDSLPALLQLDVEIILTWGQPEDPQRFWTWVTNDVLSQFHSLQRFVLKVAVYLPPAPPFRKTRDRWMPRYEPLDSWDDAAYRDLRARVTSR